MLRFCIPLFPYAAKEFAPVLMALAAAGVLHGALMASIQTDVKRLVAYSSLSHMGLVILGIFTFSFTGLQGSLFQMVSHGASMAGLFLLVGMLEERRGSRAMGDFGGVAKTAPILAVFFLWMMLSAVGLPGFSGFLGEVLILIATYKTSPVLAAIAIGGFVLSAWYLFNLFGRVFLGKSTKKAGEETKDLSIREILALLPVMAVVLWLGLHPNLILRPTEKALQMKVIEKLKPPPVMTDFAAKQRRIQEDVDKDKKKRKP
jgi:NADH-quinone oxidoreductase subunit M